MSMSADVTDTLRVLNRARQAYVRRGEAALGRGAIELTRDAKRNAPKARSQLTRSIGFSKSGTLRYVVFVSANYGRWVEQGRKRGKMPPVDSLLDWVKAKRIEPRNPNMSQEQLAWLIARKIMQSGVKEQPYFQPALDAFKRNRRLQALFKAARVGLA